MSIQDLLVKSSEWGETAVEKVLRPYVRYVDNGEIDFNDAFFDLNASKKVEISLLAKHAWKYIPGKESYSGGMKNEEIEKATMLPPGTVRPTVKSLRDKGFIRTDKDIHFATTKLLGRLVRQ